MRILAQITGFRRVHLVSLLCTKRVYAAVQQQLFRSCVTAPKSALQFRSGGTMGFKYAGETGMVAGLMWAGVCNFQKSLAWYKRPWTHVAGMAVSYYLFKAAAEWEDYALKVRVEKLPRSRFLKRDAQLVPCAPNFPPFLQGNVLFAAGVCWSGVGCMHCN